MYDSMIFGLEDQVRDLRRQLRVLEKRLETSHGTIRVVASPAVPPGEIWVHNGVTGYVFPVGSPSEGQGDG